MMGNLLILTAWSGAFLLVASESGSPFLDWHRLATDFGFPICLVVFFVWNSWKREERIAGRVTELENFVQSELMDMNEKAVKAILANTEALNRLLSAMEKRPCLCDGPDFVKKVDSVLERVEELASRKA